MTNEEAIIVLNNMKYCSGACRTEKEAIDVAISVLKYEEKKEIEENE